MKDIAIYGFGGFGREVATIINSINEISLAWNVIGFIDDGIQPGTECKYGKVLGDCQWLNSVEEEVAVVFAIGSGRIIKMLVEKINNPVVSFPNIIAPNVQFFDEETFSAGKGNVITYGCRISTDVTIGDFNILNGCVSLGHDVSMGNFNVLFPESRISGMATIGNDNFFGAKSFVMQGLRIKDNVRLGAGSILLTSPKPGFSYIGNPAKRINL